MSCIIAVGKDKLNWHTRFVQALKSENAGFPFDYKTVNMEAPDWMQQIQDADIVLWKPHFMGVKSALFFKEKVYFMQKISGKRVLPNYESIWHFESKAAQHYLFTYYDIKTPQTRVFMDHNWTDRVMDHSEFPLVFKQSDGAAGQHVKLLQSRKNARRQLQRQFAVPLYEDKKCQNGAVRAKLSNLFSSWFWMRVWQRLHAPFETSALAYVQQFIGGNPADLRVTVIGDRYAYAFWRQNRRHDFRASGSGVIDYERPVPEPVIRYCLELNKTLHFDSMCYDILFTGDDFVVSEMSYGYKDRPLYEAGGYYVNTSSGLDWVSEPCRPQTLWVRWLFESYLKHQEQHAE
ncbi:MAG: hypothetical protein U5R06_18060 [candidate division KSB1 bacterium]|nr:hypothetical protein [candidate division KSB1 bacterium]